MKTKLSKLILFLEFKTGFQSDIEDFSGVTNFVDVLYDADIKKINSFEDLYKVFEDGGVFDSDFIFNEDCMYYLLHNDPSLIETFDIVSEFGLTIEQLNSRVLANLLFSRKEREKFEALKEQIDKFFKDYK